MRITLDTRLGFYRAPVDLYGRPGESGEFRKHISLRKVVSGPPVARMDNYLVEIKLRGEQPDWLRALSHATKLVPAREGPRSFSKFLAASHAVHK
jgi:hypothetical protein